MLYETESNNWLEAANHFSQQYKEQADLLNQKEFHIAIYTLFFLLTSFLIAIPFLLLSVHLSLSLLIGTLTTLYLYAYIPFIKNTFKEYVHAFYFQWFGLEDQHPVYQTTLGKLFLKISDQTHEFHISTYMKNDHFNDFYSYTMKLISNQIEKGIGSIFKMNAFWPKQFTSSYVSRVSCLIALGFLKNNDWKKLYHDVKNDSHRKMIFRIRNHEAELSIANGTEKDTKIILTNYPKIYDILMSIEEIKRRPAFTLFYKKLDRENFVTHLETIKKTFESWEANNSDDISLKYFMLLNTLDALSNFPLQGNAIHQTIHFIHKEMKKIPQTPEILFKNIIFLINYSKRTNTYQSGWLIAFQNLRHSIEHAWPQSELSDFDEMVIWFEAYINIKNFLKHTALTDASLTLQTMFLTWKKNQEDNTLLKRFENWHFLLTCQECSVESENQTFFSKWKEIYETESKLLEIYANNNPKLEQLLFFKNILDLSKKSPVKEKRNLKQKFKSIFKRKKKSKNHFINEQLKTSLDNEEYSNHDPGLRIPLLLTRPFSCTKERNANDYETPLDIRSVFSRVPNKNTFK